MFINLITHGCLNCNHGSGVYVNRFNRDRGLATTTGIQVVLSDAGDLCGLPGSLRLSSILHIETLLLSTWADHVVQRVAMRKGLEGLESLDIEASRPSRSPLPSEQALLAQLVVGRHFTADATKHFSAGDGTCPL